MAASVPPPDRAAAAANDANDATGQSTGHPTARPVAGRPPLPRAAIAVLIGLAAVAIAGYEWRAAPGTGQGGAVAVTRDGVGGAFTLTGPNGQTVRDSDFRGRLMLIYFGYTWCPDLCPTALQTIAQALDRLGPAADRVQPLFITIDPARDTPQHLRDYTAQFDPRLIGLTGSDAAIAAAARAYGVSYRRVDSAGGAPVNSAGGDDAYLMDHSGFIYLMAADGTLDTLFDPGSDALAIASRIATLTRP